MTKHSEKASEPTGRTQHEAKRGESKNGGASKTVSVAGQKSTMPAAASKTGTKKMAAGDAKDAIALLKNDHREVKKLFATYQKLADSHAPAMQRRDVADQICEALTVHAMVEEEIFYPAVGQADGKTMPLLDEAEVEHDSVKDLIQQIQAMDPDDALYNAKVKVLGEYVNHHVLEEEGALFPKAEKSGIDLHDVGAQLQDRKDSLLGITSAE